MLGAVGYLDDEEVRQEHVDQLHSSKRVSGQNRRKAKQPVSVKAHMKDRVAVRNEEACVRSMFKFDRSTTPPPPPFRTTTEDSSPAPPSPQLEEEEQLDAQPDDWATIGKVVAVIDPYMDNPSGGSSHPANHELRQHKQARIYTPGSISTLRELYKALAQMGSPVTKRRPDEPPTPQFDIRAMIGEAAYQQYLADRREERGANLAQQQQGHGEGDSAEGRASIDAPGEF